TGTVREESDCLGVPTRDVDKVPVIVGAPHRLHIGCLFLCLCVLTDERRVPEHVGWASVNIAAEAFLVEELGPVHSQGVAVMDVRGDGDGQAIWRVADCGR